MHANTDHHQATAVYTDMFTLIFIPPSRSTMHTARQPLLLLRLPQSKAALAILPHLDGAVLATRRVQFAVRGEADAPDGTVVAFMHVCRS